ncbi:MAG: N-6 DNA methylase, partial [Bacteroidota bacterium]
LVISDELLFKHTKELSHYDFESQVDVNILGHIFENSLNEIESINAEIEGVDFDKQKTKRKKDGVFYTPKYITKYIVDNTVGKLCTEKKTELNIVEEEYCPKRQKETKKKLLVSLETYREWLLQFTILDPACGSGAFLNQALDFLIKEHQYIDELQTNLLGGGFVFPNIENTVLENNIYGVDLNEESVEIAKLSLWLRTAQPRRKLNDLSSNIKCGNSLIDSKTVAGDKAFKWEEEFSEIFVNGGFDVVIGNPPYVRVQSLKEHYYDQTVFYEKKYRSTTGNYDIYALFMEKSFGLINQKGIVSFILPHKFLIADFGLGIRQYFVDNKAVSELIHFGSELVFQDATTYTCIINLTKNEKEFLKFNHLKPIDLFDKFKSSEIPYSKLSNEQWILADNKVSEILDKLNQQPLKLKDVFARFVQGIITGKDAVFCVKGELYGDYLNITDKKGIHHKIEKGILKPHLRGEDVNKYKSLGNNEWLIFPYKFVDEKAELITPNEFESKYPYTYNYLKGYEDILREREKGKFNNESWYQYSRNQAISVLEQHKIITPEVCFGGSMTLDENNFYHNSKCHTLLLKENTDFTYKSILPLINSSLFWFYLANTGNVLRGGYIGVKRKVLEPFSIPNPESVEIEKLEGFTELMLEKNNLHQSISNKFINYLQSQFLIDKLSRKLQNWYELEFGDFIKELNKTIKKAGGEKLTKMDEMEWMDVFETKKAEAQTLKAEIDKTDKQIDQMVYGLYELSEEEIKIVENS